MVTACTVADGLIGDMGHAVALPFMITYHLVKETHWPTPYQPEKASGVERSAMERAAKAQALYDRFGMYVDPKWNHQEIAKGGARLNVTYSVKSPLNHPGRWGELRGEYAHMKAEASKALMTKDEAKERIAGMDTARNIEAQSRDAGRQAESAPGKDAPEAEPEF